MPKSRTFQPDAEYQRDRAFMLAFAAFMDSLPQAPTTIVGQGQPDGTVSYREIATPKINFEQGLEAGLAEAEARGDRLARASLRLGLQDILEMSRELAPGQIAELNGRLRALSLPSLASMQDRVWQTIPKVVARGRIRTEAEYYLLVERLNDVSDASIAEGDRDRLASIIDQYEQRKAKRPPPAA